MANLQEILNKAAELLEGSIVVASIGNGWHAHAGCPFALSHEEMKIQGYDVHILQAGQEIFHVGIKAGSSIGDEILAFILLSIKSNLQDRDQFSPLLKELLDKGLTPGVQAGLTVDMKKRLKGNVLLLEGYGEYRDEILEILANTMQLAVYAEHHGRLFLMAEARNIEEICRDLLKNILMDLLIECTLAMGGECSDASQTPILYGNCLKALQLKETFGLKDQLLVYDRLHAYRTAWEMDPALQKSIVDRIFTRKFIEMLDSELNTTIEALFSSNLNLTDTAAKLYIHRNTLLYRLEKIYRCTGFDLKKFEDSWLFRLGWLIYKGKHK